MGVLWARAAIAAATMPGLTAAPLQCVIAVFNLLKEGQEVSLRVPPAPDVHVNYGISRVHESPDLLSDRRSDGAVLAIGGHIEEDRELSIVVRKVDVCGESNVVPHRNPDIIKHVVLRHGEQDRRIHFKRL